MEAKRRLLARAAAAALQNDDKIDPAALIVSALSQLEPVHIRALARLAKTARSARDDDDREVVMRAASEAEAVPVLAALIQTGVAIATTMYSSGDGLGSPAETTGHFSFTT